MSPSPHLLLNDAAEWRDLDPRQWHHLADRIAALHAAAPAASRARPIEAPLPEQRAALLRHAEHLAARVKAGRVRKGHGDLRLETIALGPPGPAPIGGAGVERDILFDLASLLADLWTRGLTMPANLVANRYVDVAPQGARGWALLPLFLSLHAADPDLLGSGTPRLVAIGGLSGTGKSTLARLLGARIGTAPGARVLRSDVFRKRLLGLPPESRLPPSHYTARSDEATWEALFESADDHLSCGTSVILDAVFMRRSERDVAEMLAARARVPFTGLWLEAPERDRIERVSARSGDASDACADVVREQSKRSVGELGRWHRMRVNRPQEIVVAAARGILDRVAR